MVNTTGDNFDVGDGVRRSAVQVVTNPFVIAGKVFDEIEIDEGFEPFVHTVYYCRCLLGCSIARCRGVQ